MKSLSEGCGFHAFMIGAYQYPNYLESLIDSLDGEHTNIYIHVNDRNKKDFLPLIIKMSSKKNVFFVDSLKINWGGRGLLMASRIMLNAALKDKRNEFFHLLSGQDALIKPIEELYKFFNNNNNNYLSISEGPISVDKPHPCLDWIKYYHTYDLLNYRGFFINKIVEKVFVCFQKLFGIRRDIPYSKLYKGSGWYSINRNAALILQKALNDEFAVGKWKYSFATEEMFPHTVLYNVNEDLKFVNNDLRFVVWDYKNKLLPATLDESYFDEIRKSGNFFCRKIDPIISNKLLENLKQMTNK